MISKISPGAVDAAFDEAFDIHGAVLVTAEAVLVSIAQIVEVEVLRAAIVGSIQEGTMTLHGVHELSSAGDARRFVYRLGGSKFVNGWDAMRG
jgi:hypothetical protein